MVENHKRIIYRTIAALAVAAVLAVVGWTWDLGKRVEKCEKNGAVVEEKLKTMDWKLDKIMEKLGVWDPPKQGGNPK